MRPLLLGCLGMRVGWSIGSQMVVLGAIGLWELAVLRAKHRRAAKKERPFAFLGGAWLALFAVLLFSYCVTRGWWVGVGRGSAHISALRQWAAAIRAAKHAQLGFEEGSRRQAPAWVGAAIVSVWMLFTVAAPVCILAATL